MKGNIVYKGKMEKPSDCEVSRQGPTFYQYRDFFLEQNIFDTCSGTFPVPNLSNTDSETSFRYHFFSIQIPVPQKNANSWYWYVTLFSINQHKIKQHQSASVSISHHQSESISLNKNQSTSININQHKSADSQHQTT